MKQTTILVLNAGSSSLKFQLFAVTGGDLRRLLRGQCEGIGTRPRLRAEDKDGSQVADEYLSGPEAKDLPAALNTVVNFLRSSIGTMPTAIGHRVVHGGPHFSAPIVITDDVIASLEKLVPLAPLHQPNNLAPIRAIAERQLPVLQVACFDTAFHRAHPDVADRYAIPDELYEKGVRRYGFHGLSYEFISGRLKDIAPDIHSGRVIIAHLGSGSSMCALNSGRSVESTMGFTALDGLPMGTRPGQIDAGVILYLMNEHGMTAKAVEAFLYNECGLKGLSGLSNDVRDLLASPDPRAKRAIDYFVYRTALNTGMLMAALGGLDAFIFTAGIGEHSPRVRAEIADRLDWTGLKIDSHRNQTHQLKISADGSYPACYVIPTDEEVVIARHTLNSLRAVNSHSGVSPR